MKKAVMYGAGNIGRGFIVQLFCESGYETALIDVNMTVINKLNEDGKYPVYVTRGETYEEHIVDHVRGVDGKDVAAIAREIADADIMATAVGVNILKFIAPNVAEGVKLRCKEKIEAPLNIIICENMIGADAYFTGLVKGYLDEAEKAYFDSHIALVEPSIGRMVPATPKEIAEKNPLAVCVEEYCELPVDKAAFKGEIPQIAHMVPFTPFDFYIQRKLFMHNMSHAITAYFGKRKGYTYIWEASEDAEIKYLSLRALLESSRALSAEHGVDLGSLIDFSGNLLHRYENKLLGDTIDRVGRDTKRKLSENDRFVGAAKLCLKHGILPVNICAGIAAALFFAPEGDPTSAEVHAYAEEHGPEAALVQYCGIEKDSPLQGLVRNVYDRLKAGEALMSVICAINDR